MNGKCWLANMTIKLVMFVLVHVSVCYLTQNVPSFPPCETLPDRPMQPGGAQSAKPFKNDERTFNVSVPLHQRGQYNWV